MKELRIKDICDKGSSNLKQKDVEGKNGLYPVYGASGIISHIDTYHQEENYIAIVKDGSGIGRVTFMPAKSSVIGTMQYILPKEGFNINYIGYCLQSLDLSKYKQGAAIPHIYFRDYGERIVKVTEDTKEQQSIVDYLDSAFAKIDAMKANAEKALNEAKALDCPHSTPRKVNYPTQYPCIRTSEIKGGKIEWNSMQYLDEEEYIVRTTRIKPKANDIVYGREGSYGDAVLLPEGYNFSLGQRTMLFRPDIKIVLPYFLHYSVISSYVYEQAKAKNSGCGVGHVNVKDIKLFIIGIPKSLSEQQSIVDYLDSAFAKIDAMKANAEKALNEAKALIPNIEKTEALARCLLLSEVRSALSAHLCLLSAFSACSWRPYCGPDGAGRTQR